MLTKILLTLKCICAKVDLINFKCICAQEDYSFYQSQPWELIRRQEEEDQTRGMYSHFSSYVGLASASTVHAKTIQAPQKHLKF